MRRSGEQSERSVKETFNALEKIGAFQWRVNDLLQELSKVADDYCSVPTDV